MTRPSVLALCFLIMGCGRGATEPALASAPTATSTALAAPAARDEPVAVPAPTRDEQLTQIRAVFANLETDQALTSAPYKLECGNNVMRAEGRRFLREGATQKAQLSIWPPGDTSVEYHFYYDRTDVVFALYRVVGYAGDFKHTIEYRYYFASGQPLQCLRKDAKGSEAEVAARLPNAENKPDDCRFADEALAIGNALKVDASSSELTKLACAI